MLHVFWPNRGNIRGKHKPGCMVAMVHLDRLFSHGLIDRLCHSFVQTAHVCLLDHEDSGRYSHTHPIPIMLKRVFVITD